MSNIFGTNMRTQEVKDKLSLVRDLSITVAEVKGGTSIIVESSHDVSAVRGRLEAELGRGNVTWFDQAEVAQS